MNRKKHDVIVVGAGPAGCSAATFLAGNGCSVLLVDKAKFPRDKACGDGLSPSALDVLERMGVTGRMEKSRPWRIDGVEFSSPAGKKLRTQFQQIEGLGNHSYVLPRKDLDFVLFKHVRELSNVVVLENCEVRDLVHEENAVSGVRVNYENESKEFSGKVVVGADGVHSIIARKTSFLNSNAKHRVLAARAYFDNVPGLDHYIEIHCDKSILPGYGWVFPTGEGSANVGVGTSCRSATRKKDIKTLFDTFLEQNKSMKNRFNKTQMIGNSLKTWPIPLGSCSSKRSYENVILIGDAGSFADTLTGEGIYYALRSGEYAAQAITIGLNNNINKIADIFERLWRREFKRREYILGYLIQRFVFGEFFLNFNINRALRNDKMAEALVEILCHRKSKLRLLV